MNKRRKWKRERESWARRGAHIEKHQSCKKQHQISIIISKTHSSRKYHKGQNTEKDKNHRHSTQNRRKKKKRKQCTSNQTLAKKKTSTQEAQQETTQCQKQKDPHSSS